MKVKGPILTLAAGAVLAGALVTLSVAATTRNAGNNAANTVAASATAAPSASNAAQASASASPSNTVPAQAAAPTMFAGVVDGGAASIAIAIRDGKALAYVCDGKKVEAWLQGSSSTAGQLSLTSTGSTLSGQYADGWASGTVSTNGKQWTFRIKVAQAPSGLYRVAQRVANKQVLGGWIVDGQKVTGLINSDGVTTPAPPIDPATGNVTIDGTTVKAGPADPTG